MDLGIEIMRFYIIANVFLVLGMILVQYLRQEKIVVAMKRSLDWFGYIVSGSFILVFLYVLFRNVNIIIDPTQGGKVPINTYDEFLKALLKSKVNLMLMSIGAFFGLSGLLSMIIRMPFSNWEHIKFFGFEYKRKIEEIKDTAKEALDEAKQLGIVRLQVLDIIASETMYETLKDLQQGNTIDGYSAIIEVLNGIELFFDEELETKLFTGVVPVENDVLNPVYFDPLQERVRETVHRTFVSPESLKPNNGKGMSIIALPIMIGQTTNPYFIAYLYSYDYVFTNADIEMVNIAHSILNIHIARLESASGNGRQPVREVVD